MDSRARAIGEDFAGAEAQMEAINASLAPKRYTVRVDIDVEAENAEAARQIVRDAFGTMSGALSPLWPYDVYRDDEQVIGYGWNAEEDEA